MRQIKRLKDLTNERQFTKIHSFRSFFPFNKLVKLTDAEDNCIEKIRTMNPHLEVNLSSTLSQHISTDSCHISPEVLFVNYNHLKNKVNFSFKTSNITVKKSITPFLTFLPFNVTLREEEELRFPGLYFQTTPPIMNLKQIKTKYTK